MIATMFTFRILLKLYDPFKVKLTLQGRLPTLFYSSCNWNEENVLRTEALS